MRIVLAYPFEGHAPDEIIDAERAVARKLLNSGRARVAPDVVAAAAPVTPLTKMTVKELKAYAAEHSIGIAPHVRKRLDIAEAIRAAQTREPSTQTPDSGSKNEEAPDVG